MKLSLLAPLLAMLASACSTTTDLSYESAAKPLQAAAPAIGAVTVSDARGTKGANELGAVHGGYGAPFKTLVTSRPIPDEIEAAFKSALRRRNLLLTGAPMVLVITLRDVEAEQQIQRTAKIAFSLQVLYTDRKLIYSDAVEVENTNGSLIGLNVGLFGSVSDLQALLTKTLAESIDEALDKPKFRAALANRV